MQLTNFLKGGDFMGLEQDNPARETAIEDAISRMIWEGSPVPAVIDPNSKNTSFPERNGRTRIPPASEIAAKPGPLLGQLR